MVLSFPSLLLLPLHYFDPSLRTYLLEYFAFMEEKKNHKTQAIKVLLLTIFLVLIPFMSSTMRSSYLYFLLNLLILVLAMEAGVLGSPPSKTNPIEEIKKPNKTTTTDNYYPSTTTSGPIVLSDDDRKPASTVPEKAVFSISSVKRPRKSPSMPSLFFIGDDMENKEMVMVVEEAEDEDYDAGELFVRAETFIGNFYKQLKMQREESWNKIHGFYHKPL